MPGLVMIDVVIGVIFVYLILSIIASSTKEAIEALVKKRSKLLKTGLKDILGNSELVTEVLTHPLVCGLYRGKYKPPSDMDESIDNKFSLPSYIPKQVFAAALLDILFNKNSNLGGAQGFNQDGSPKTPQASGNSTISSSTNREQKSETTDSKFINPGFLQGNQSKGSDEILDSINLVDGKYSDIKGALTALVGSGRPSLEQLRHNLEAWYDQAMERVSGTYKRWSQGVILFISFIVVILLNADTISIIKALSTNSQLQTKMVEDLQNNFQNFNPAKIQGNVKDDEAKKNLKQIRDGMDQLLQLGLPIGWQTNPFSGKNFTEVSFYLFGKIPGWFMTGIAISFGAQFWFEILSKFINLRSTIKPNLRQAT